MRSVVLSIVLLLASALPALGESTADSLAAARARLEQLRRETDATTQRYEDALSRVATLDDEIADAERALRRLDARVDAITAVVQQRAIEAYLGSTGSISAGTDTGDVLDAARASLLLSTANAADADDVDALGEVTDDVRAARKELRDKRAAQKDLVAELQREQRSLEAQLAETTRLEAELEVRLSREQEAERRRVAAQLAAQRAREAAAASVAQDSGADDDGGGSGGGGSDGGGSVGGGGGGVIAPPSGPGVLGVQVCPIQGAVSFADTWQAARPGGRLHMGVDLMTTMGSPNVAVTSGTVSHDYGDLMGNAVFLYGDNGNTYYYFHLSSLASAGRVQTGQVVGYSGDSGNARGGAVHTHFEIHPGGGGAVNPTAAVAAVC